MKIKFEFEKETKGTFRFKALEEDAGISTVYIKKSAIKELGLNLKDTLVITLERGDAIE